MINNSQKVKKRIYRNLNYNIKELASQKSLVGEKVTQSILFEGDKLGVFRDENSKTVSSLKRIEASSIVKMEDISSDSISKVIDDLSSQLADAQSRLLIDTVSDAAGSVGNTVNGNGGPPSADLMLQMIEKIQIDFEGDIPKLPTLVCSPQSMDSFKKAVEQMVTTEPHKSKYEEILKKKRQEFDEREASRKLVD